MCWTKAHPSVSPSFLLTKRRNRLPTPSIWSTGPPAPGKPPASSPGDPAPAGAHGPWAAPEHMGAPCPSSCPPLHSRCPFLTLLCQLGSASGVIGASESMAGTRWAGVSFLLCMGTRQKRHGGEASPWPLLGLGDSPARIWSRTENRMCWTRGQSSALSFSRPVPK